MAPKTSLQGLLWPSSAPIYQVALPTPFAFHAMTCDEQPAKLCAISLGLKIKFNFGSSFYQIKSKRSSDQWIVQVGNHRIKSREACNLRSRKSLSFGNEAISCVAFIGREMLCVVSPGSPVFPSPQKPTFPNSNSTWNCQALYHEPLARVITQALPVFDIKIYFHIYVYIRTAAGI